MEKVDKLLRKIQEEAAARRQLLEQGKIRLVPETPAPSPPQEQPQPAPPNKPDKPDKPDGV